MGKAAQVLTSSSAVPTLDLAPPKPWRRFVPSWLRSLLWVDSISEYDAFLSYSWKSDSKIAPVVQSVIQKFLCPWYKFRAKSVFRDLSSLPAGSSLEAELCDRLDRSTHLVVLASPEAAASHGMEIEARHWFSQPRKGQLLILIFSGELRKWEDGRDHLLPPSLAKNLIAEPLWIPLQHRRQRILANPDDPQLRGELTEDLKQLLLRLYDGHDWDQLRGQERLQRQRARWLVSGVILLLLALLGTAVTFWSSAREQRAQAEVQRDKARTQLLAIQARRASRTTQSPDQFMLAGALALESIWLAQKNTLAPEADAIEAVRDTLTRLPLTSLSYDRGGVESLGVLPDGRLASGGSDGTITIWPIDGMGELVVLSHDRSMGYYYNPVNSLVVLADGRLASGSFNGTIKLWPKEGRGEPVVLTHGSEVNSLVVLADGRLASGGSDGTIKLWPKEGRGEPVVLSHGSKVNSLVVLADRRLASGGSDGTIKLWPKEGTGEPVVLSHGDNNVWPLVVLADGRLASGSFDGTIKLWPKEGRGEPVVLSHGSKVISLVVLADGRLASGSFDGTIKLWPKEGTDEPVVLSHGDNIVGSLVVLADGRLASGSLDGTIKLWPKEGTSEPVILLHGDYGVWSLVVLADGRLASGSNDGTIKLWPKEGWGEPVVLTHGSAVKSLVVLADGRLASGGSDGTIKLWLVEEQQLIAALCLRVGRNLTKSEWVRYLGADTPWQPSCRDLPSNWRTPD